MGSFFGHVIPGLFLIIMATWWIIQILRRYFRKSNPDASPFYSSVFFPVTIRGCSVKVDAYLMGMFSILGILLEVVVSPTLHGEVRQVNLQHFTMFLSFGLIVLPAIILPKFQLLPKEICEELTYIYYIIADVITGLMFQNHLNFKAGPDVVLHTLLLYTIYGVASITLLEKKYRKNVLLPLGRVFLTFLQGTWFWQIAFMVYLDNLWGYVDDKHQSLHSLSEEGSQSLEMKIAYMFAWHIMAHLGWMTVCTVCFARYYKEGTSGGSLPVDLEDPLNERFETATMAQNGYDLLQQNEEV